jgi:hypothetical protein
LIGLRNYVLQPIDAFDEGSGVIPGGVDATKKNFPLIWQTDPLNKSFTKPLLYYTLSIYIEASLLFAWC